MSKKTRMILIAAVTLAALVLGPYCFQAGGANAEKSGEGAAADQVSAGAEPNGQAAQVDWLRDTETETGPKERNFGLIRQLFISLFFVAILGGCAYFLSRKLSPRMTSGAGKNICIIESLNLGSHKTLHLLEIGSGRQKLLVAATNEGVSVIADVSEALQGMGEADYPGSVTL